MKHIRERCRNKQLIAELKEKHKGQGRKKLDGGGQRAVDSDLDDIILKWIYGRRANGLRVSQKLIMVKAKHSNDERCPEGKQDMFKDTEGWLQTFTLRHGLSLTRKTTTEKHCTLSCTVSYLLVSHSF